MVLALIAVHIFFVCYVWTRISMLSAVLCLVIPVYALYLYYRDWHLLRGFFFAELALIVAIIVFSG